MSTRDRVPPPGIANPAPPPSSTRSARTSDMLSSAVWRRPSRSATLAFGSGCVLALTPSWLVMVPSWFTSTPRPWDVTVTVEGGAVRLMVTKLAGPYEWPTGSMAIVAMHLRRFSSEARKTSYLERVIPGPKIATGHPVLGCTQGAPGVIAAKPMVSDRTACGPGPAVGGVGMVRVVASSHCGAVNDPNAYVPAPTVDGSVLSKTCSVWV